MQELPSAVPNINVQEKINLAIANQTFGDLSYLLNEDGELYDNLHTEMQNALESQFAGPLTANRVQFREKLRAELLAIWKKGYGME